MNVVRARDARHLLLRYLLSTNIASDSFEQQSRPDLTGLVRHTRSGGVLDPCSLTLRAP